MKRASITRVLVFALLIVTAVSGRAHPACATSAIAKLQRDGRCTVTLTFDVLAFALNDLPERVPDAPMLALLDGPPAELERRLAQAKERFQRHFAVQVGESEMTLTRFRFPSVADVQAWKARPEPARLPVLLSCDLETQIPTGAQSVAFCFPEVIGTVVLTVERPGEEAWVEPVPPGSPSARLAVVLGVPPPASPESWLHRALRDAASDLGTIGRFVGLGFVHILPRGLDHVLFVLGLFLLAGRLSALLWQVTAFTVAHSVTLALSLYGVVRLPAPVVEPLIAASIALVALDNLRGRELPWWRIAVVFGFGLIHGMGFAGALRELGLPRSEFLRALIGFNFGVELGQLAVIALAFAVVGWWRERPFYHRTVVVPASVGIAAVALMWTVQRIGG